MRLVCGLDVETSGLDVDNDRVQELAWVFWDVDAKTIFSAESHLISSGPIGEYFKETSGLTDEHLAIPNGKAFNGVLLRLQTALALNHPLAIVAHNGNSFDRRILENHAKREGCENNIIFQKLWIDTKTDIEYPKNIKSKTLSHLATDLCGFSNPFPHRALTDTLTMLTILSQFNFDEVLANARIPTVTVIAKTPYEKRDIPKSRYYNWNGTTKQWTKVIKENKFDEENNALAPWGVEKL